MTDDVRAAADVAREYLGPNGGVLLDVKSTTSTAADIALFVAQLQKSASKWPASAR